MAERYENDHRRDDGPAVGRGDGPVRGLTDGFGGGSTGGSTDGFATGFGDGFDDGFEDGAEGGEHVVDPDSVIERGGWTVVPVRGDLDFYSAPLFAEAVRSLAAPGPRRVVLDLADVEFMDSTGLRLLLGVSRDLREAGGALRLAGPGDLVLRLLEVTQVAPLLPAFPDVTSACSD
ncbi:STAS domain-containing protein [Yinghuangia sp. YIM S09857]|uniref:STAS domain-containing protein n=1 Tax=Yinghuangia sp. YIM S09857 TaxID=3436929 RepID=UPI003F52B297